MQPTLQFLDDGTDSSVHVVAEEARVVIFPVPLEKTVSYLSGTASAPLRILEASSQVELFDPELKCSPFRTGIHTFPPLDCRRDLESVLEELQRLVSAFAPAGKIPVCLGGEHILSLAPIKALLGRCPGLSVLHLDAHADLRPAYRGNELSHACMLRRVRELGLPTVSVGVRSVSEEEAGFIAENSVAIYPAWRYPGGEYPWEEIVGALGDRVYISVDMDAFDPSEVPGVGTPEPGGMIWYQALRLFQTLRSANKPVVGFDLVELCPQKNSVVSEFFAARLLYKMIGYFCCSFIH